MSAVGYGLGGGRAWSGGSAQAAHVLGEDPTEYCARGPRARAEGTSNMLFMEWTLDVLRLSGWLNASAHCRVGRNAHDASLGPRGGRECGRRRRTRHTCTGKA